MRSLQSFTPRVLGVTCLVLAQVACHSHDDEAGTSTFVPPAGSSGDFLFDAPTRLIRGGEIGDFVARNMDGTLAGIGTWEIVARPGNSSYGLGSLVNMADPSTVRFIAGTPGFYALRAVDAAGNEGFFGFDVVDPAGTLRVSEVMIGDDLDEVSARLATSGDDIFIADIIGDATAPQRFAKANRDGDRVVETTLTYKVADVGADASGNVFTLVSGATDFPSALRRYDDVLVEDTNFSAVDFGAGVTWSPRLSVTDDGRILVVRSGQSGGGEVVSLGLDGQPLVGFPAAPIAANPADVVDLATDSDGSVYVATETSVIRVLSGGTVDTPTWSPSPSAMFTAVRAISTDGRGVLYVLQQDIDGGQCGSLRKLNFTGSEVAMLTSLNVGTFFAARKIIDGIDLAAYEDGSCRIYDDIVSIDPTNPRAAWIVAGDAPPASNFK